MVPGVMNWLAGFFVRKGLTCLILVGLVYHWKIIVRSMAIMYTVHSTVVHMSSRRKDAIANIRQ